MSLWLSRCDWFCFLIGFVHSSLHHGFLTTPFQRQQENLANINGYIEEIYTGQAVVTSYNASEESSQAFKGLNDKLYKSMWQSQFISGIMMPLMIFIGNFGYVMVCLVGAIKVIDGSLTIGDVVAFMTYVRIFSQPLSQIAQGITQLQSATAAIGRIFEFLEEKDMDNESAKTAELTDTKGQVVFDHVSFGYTPEKKILNKISLYAKPGQKIAFVGSTGAGKTTIINLINRFYEIQSGTITYDGLDIRNIRKKDLRRSLSMVIQDTHLFTGTIADNIRYGRLKAGEADIREAARIANADSFIRRLPEGYDTMLHSDGSNLSQGQRQLLAIARAAISRPPVLILDEATSSIDTRTERLIEKGMDSLMEGRTVFVIAHRLSTIRKAQRILVLTDDGIAEEGTHEELMQRDGLYSSLYKLSFV